MLRVPGPKAFIILALGVLALASCTNGGELSSPPVPTPALTPTLTPDPTTTATPTVTSTATLTREEAGSTLPDLTVTGVGIRLETGGRCDYTFTTLGLAFGIKNVGSGDAGPFAVIANGVRETVTSGLAPGQSIDLWFPGYGTSVQEVFVDATFQVEESNEDNNRYSAFVPIPTLPPTCTPTPGQ